MSEGVVSLTLKVTAPTGVHKRPDGVACAYLANPPACTKCGAVLEETPPDQLRTTELGQVRSWRDGEFWFARYDHHKAVTFQSRKSRAMAIAYVLEWMAADTLTNARLSE